MKAQRALEIKSQMGKKYRDGMTITVNKKLFILERFQTEGVDEVWCTPYNPDFPNEGLPVGKLVRHPTAFGKGFYHLYTKQVDDETLDAIKKIVSSLVYN